MANSLHRCRAVRLKALIRLLRRYRAFLRCASRWTLVGRTGAHSQRSRCLLHQDSLSHSAHRVCSHLADRQRQDENKVAVHVLRREAWTKPEYGCENKRRRENNERGCYKRLMLDEA